MRQFFKLILTSCLGTFLAIGLLLLVFFLIGLSSIPTQTVPTNAVLHLTFEGQLPDLTNNVAQGTFSLEQGDVIGLNDLRLLIKSAATDSNIKGILLQPENTSVGTTNALYIAGLIEEFKSSGKFVHAYGNYFTQSGYIIANVADSVIMNPNGIVDLHGFGMAIPYFKNFSEKSKIKFDVYHAGKFKSAIEPYYRSESSDENRLQTQQYLTSYQDAVISQISANRDLSIDKVKDIIVNALSDDQAQTSLDLGLVDKISYWEEYEESLKTKLEAKKLNLLSLEDYWKNTILNSGKGSDRIAIVYAEGEIAQSGKEKGSVSMERYAEMLDKIKNNKKIKAVVLRVNSPGGSAFTSDLFWKKIEDLKAEGKYVLASYGTYAASGGYYISCGADKIVSEPTTLTGSIGVFAMIPDMSEFFADNLGVNWDTIGTGNYTFLYSLMVPRGPAANAKLMSNTERTYDTFLTRVAEGRNMTKEAVHEIAQGRVWSGVQGVEIGLVDTLGTLDDAINIAAKEVGLTDYKILQYPFIKKTFYEELLNEIMATTEAKLFAKGPVESKIQQTIRSYISYVEQACKTPQARLPFSIIE
jgi:protease-4